MKNYFIFNLVILFISTLQAQSSSTLSETKQFAPQVVREYVRKGVFYKINQKSDKPLFTQETLYTILGPLDRKTRSLIKDQDNKIIMEETAEISNGEILNQVMIQKQINEKYQLIRNNNEVIFKTFKIKEVVNSKGQAEYQEELVEENKTKVSQNFATGPSLEVYLNKKFSSLTREQLQNGLPKLQVSFGIFELQKPINFKLTEVKSPFTEEFKKDQEKSIKLEIDNVVFSLFVDPLLVDYDFKSWSMIRYRGRTPVRTKNEKGQWSPLDADIYYEEIAKANSSFR